jgi:hypothetical protein
MGTRTMMAIRTVALALIATLMTMSESGAQAPNVLPPSLSYPLKQYYRDHPQEWQQFLSQLAQQRQQPVGTPHMAPAGGTWSTVQNSPLANLGLPLLLTDGSVIFNAICSSGTWYKLTPDINGNYATGSWSPIASLPVINGIQYNPLWYASQVLPDGRVIINGGEFNFDAGCANTDPFTTKGAIYDPVGDAWTAVAPPGGWSGIGDAQSVVLANGTYMLANPLNLQMVLLNIGNMSWTPTGSGKFDRNDEEGWSLLPNGKVLTVDAYTGTGTCGTNSEVYDPSTGSWASAGSTIVQLPDCSGVKSFEVGPQVLRPDGTLVAFGATTTGTAHTAIFNSSLGTWSQGSDILSVCGAQSTTPCTLADAPAALLPNGNILFAAAPSNWPASNSFLSGTHFFELNYSDNTIAQVTDAANAASLASYNFNFLLLPTGEVLVVQFGSVVQIYTPSNQNYQASWQPVVQSVPTTLRAGGTYAASGTQFSALSFGASYGDDYQSSTNFPLVRIVNNATQHVFYARTFNHSTRSVAPNMAGSTNFKVPANIELGASTLYVVANGIPSAGTPVTITAGPGCVVLVETHDFNGDCIGDILWRNSNGGGVALWFMSSNSILSSAGVGSLSVADWTIVGQRDINADGNADILWRSSNGGVALWFMNGNGTISSAVGVGSLPVSWGVAGTGDFNGDGIGDILWRDNSGNVGIWFMASNGTVQSSVGVGNVPNNWVIAGTGDFNGDGIRDILWRETSAGGIGLWLMNNNGTIKSGIGLGSVPFNSWTIVGTGDFNGDGVSDILWRENTGGGVAMWLMNNNGTIKSAVGVGSLPLVSWTVAETGDFNGDGKSDILWYGSNGGVAVWLMNGATITAALGVGSLPTDWQIQSANAD